MKKYEIHLPLNSSDGEPIDPEAIRRVREELVAAFGAFAVPDKKTWKYAGAEYIEIMKIEIITAGDKATKKRFKELKEQFKESLRQVDILITTYGIQEV